jgi:hypothetical protein
MIRYKAKEKIVIELFDEKTGSLVRTISFHEPKELYEFEKDFNEIRYLGYGWRYKDKERKKNEASSQ